MYVCIEVALRENAHGIGRPTGPGGRGPSKVGLMSQPRGYHQSHVIHTGSYSCSMALSEPTLIWVAKVNLYPHVGGTGSYQARKVARTNVSNWADRGPRDRFHPCFSDDPQNTRQD